MLSEYRGFLMIRGEFSGETVKTEWIDTEYTPMVRTLEVIWDWKEKMTWQEKVKKMIDEWRVKEVSRLVV